EIKARVARHPPELVEIDQPVAFPPLMHVDVRRGGATPDILALGQKLGLLARLGLRFVCRGLEVGNLYRYPEIRIRLRPHHRVEWIVILVDRVDDAPEVL